MMVLFGTRDRNKADRRRLLAGGGASSTINAGRTAAATPISVQIDPFQAIVKANGFAYLAL
jgi:hypothetical protein